MAGTWFGDASASLVGGNWTLNSGALGCTTPAATTDYPEWSQTFVGSPAMWQPETP